MLKNKHDEVLGTLKDMEESKKKDIPKIETKNGRIENLAKYNNQACTGIQNQFGDINGNNWSRIATLESYKERLKNVMLEYDNYKNSHPEKHTGAAEIMKVDDKCELTSCMNQMKAEHEEFVTLLILERQKNLRTRKQQYQERIDMLNNKHDEVLGTLKDMEESKKKDIPKIETKNGRIENLAKYHNQACTGIQNQFGDINGNNWSRISTLELNEELTGMSDEIGQLEITASQSGPHTLMSQGTSGTAPPTRDAKGGSMP